MPGICKICALDNRKRRRIEADYLNGMTPQRIYQKYKLESKDSLRNHLKHHLAAAMVKASEFEEINHGTNLLARIDTLLERVELIFQRNFDNHHDRTALKALSEERSTLELISKISYLMHQNKITEMEIKRRQETKKNIPIEILTREEKQAYFDINLKLMKHMDKQVEIERDEIEGGRWSETVRI